MSLKEVIEGSMIAAHNGPFVAVACAGRSRGLLLALGAIEDLAKFAVAAFLRHDPETVGPRRLMTNMLMMPALQFSDPVRLVVLVISDDPLFHVLDGDIANDVHTDLSEKVRALFSLDDLKKTVTESDIGDHAHAYGRNGDQTMNDHGYKRVKPKFKSA